MDLRIAMFIASLLTAGCAAQTTMPDGSVSYGFHSKAGKITDRGMACANLDYARLHEEVRNKKDPTPYEVQQLANTPGCLVATMGRDVQILGHSLGGSFYRVAPTGSFNQFWVPRRIVTTH